MRDVELNSFGGVEEKGNRSATTLWEYLGSNRPHVQSFLLYSGNIWMKTLDIKSMVWNVYFVSVYALIIVGAVLSIVIAGDLVRYPYFVVIYVALAIQLLSALPGHYYNQARLHTIMGELEITVLDSSLKTSLYFLLANISVVVFLLVVICLVSEEVNFVTPIMVISQFFLVIYLAFNLLMLLIDVQVSALQVDRLIARCTTNTITMSDFISAREQIRSRSEGSKWITNILLIPCIACVLSTIFLVYVIDTEDFNTYNDLFQIGSLFIFLKEIVFAAISFWYVAKVNGKADELTILLSKALHAPDEETGVNLKLIPLYAACMSEPIGYTLVYRRISWSDVAINAFGFSVSVSIGFVKFFVAVGTR